MVTSVLIVLGIFAAIAVWFVLHVILSELIGYILGVGIIIVGLVIVVFGLSVFTAGGTQGAVGLIVAIFGVLVVLLGGHMIYSEIHPSDSDDY